MKKHVNIFIISLALISVQACNPKSENQSNGETMEVSTPVATLEERRERIEKERLIRVENRRLALEERVKKAAFYTDDKKNIVYNKAEVDPKYTGGEEAMEKYLKENMKYPEQAEKDQLEATIFVDFIVGSNGSVTEVMTSEMPGEEVDQSLREEAIRVVSNMPKWIPGRQNGKLVAVKFSLPITFRII